MKDVRKEIAAQVFRKPRRRKIVTEPSIALMRDDKLLKKAIEIFGDIVVDAFLCAEDYGYTKRQIERSLVPYSDDTDYLDFGADHIRIVFSNGKVVDLVSSEWGSASNCKYKSYEV